MGLTRISSRQFSPLASLAQSTPISGAGNPFLSVLLHSHNNELVSPIPESFTQASKEKPIDIFGVLLAMRVHQVPDDLVVKEGRMPYACYAWKIRQLGRAELHNRTRLSWFRFVCGYGGRCGQS